MRANRQDRQVGRLVSRACCLLLKLAVQASVTQHNPDSRMHTRDNTERDEPVHSSTPPPLAGRMQLLRAGPHPKYLDLVNGSRFEYLYKTSMPWSK